MVSLRTQFIIAHVDMDLARLERTSDSCNVNLPLKLVKIEFLVYPRISLEISCFQPPITGYEFIF